MRLKKCFRREMIRPIIYQVFTRAAVTLTAILAAREFSPDDRPVLPWGCKIGRAHV